MIDFLFFSNKCNQRKIFLTYIVSFFVLIGASSNKAIAQEETEVISKNYYKLPLVSGGAGLLIFNGDVGKSASVKGFTRFRPGYNLSVEKLFNSFLGVTANGMMGKLSDNEVVGGHNNFESKIAQGDLMAVFHFDNGFILPKTHQTAPYIAAGVSFLSYNTFSDLKDANGNTYNYWRDGSIRNLPEEPANRFSSKIIKRDYTYETNIKKGSTFSIPIALGLAVKLSQNIALCLQQSVYLPMTDEIDNIKNGGNDMYFYTSASLRVSLSGHYKDQNPIYKDVDYLALENTDSDGDGVKDGKDLCPGTPKGVKVDGVGCPLDSDSDGIPDYRDKEPHSKSLNVDENGIALTDESIQKKYGEEVATEEHSAVTELMKKKDQQLASKAKSGTMSKLPAKFAPADLNHDGIITSNEISEAIDSFFVGDSQFTVQKLNDLIDYFFEQ